MVNDQRVVNAKGLTETAALLAYFGGFTIFSRPKNGSSEQKIYA